MTPEQILIRWRDTSGVGIRYNYCMADTLVRRALTQMSPRERELRSQLKQILLGLGVVRGTLAVRETTCGKANCRCKRGLKHVALYLVASEQGKLRQLFIPKSLQPQTRQWVASYQQVRELLEELSRLHWERLEQRKP
jgi:hypothetical protein